MTVRGVRFRDLALVTIGAWFIVFSGFLFRIGEWFLVLPSLGVVAFATLVTYLRLGSVVWTAAFSATLPPLFLAILITRWYLDPDPTGDWGLMDGAVGIVFLSMTVFGAFPAVIGVLVHLGLERV
jgi:hypothetical protein